MDPSAACRGPQSFRPCSKTPCGRQRLSRPPPLLQDFIRPATSFQPPSMRVLPSSPCTSLHVTSQTLHVTSQTLHARPSKLSSKLHLPGSSCTLPPSSTSHARPSMLTSLQAPPLRLFMYASSKLHLPCTSLHAHVPPSSPCLPALSPSMHVPPRVHGHALSSSHSPLQLFTRSEKQSIPCSRLHALSSRRLRSQPSAPDSTEAPDSSSVPDPASDPLQLQTSSQPAPAIPETRRRLPAPLTSRPRASQRLPRRPTSTASLPASSVFLAGHATDHPRWPWSSAASPSSVFLAGLPRRLPTFPASFRAGFIDLPGLSSCSDSDFLCSSRLPPRWHATCMGAHGTFGILLGLGVK